MKYLLDTCVISEFVKPVPNKKVVTWIQTRSSETFFLSVITIGEVRKGLMKLPKSKKKEKLTAWLDTLLHEYNDRILPIDLLVAEQWGIMQGRAEKQGTPMASIDGLIAATTRTHNLTLVTRNESDFPSSHIDMVNPW